MTYRHREAPGAPITIRYGPFPRRWVETLLGLGGGVFLALAAVGIFGRETLSCDRNGEPAACVHRVERSLLPSSTTTLPLEAIVEVKWVSHEGSKGGPRGRTELIDRRGSPHRVFDGDREDARRAHETIAAFFRDEGIGRLEWTSDRPWLTSLLLALLAFVLIAIGASAIRHPSSIRLTLDRARNTLRVSRRWFGLPLERRHFSFDHLKDVEVETGTLDFLGRTSAQQPVPAGRLVLVEGDGRRVPLSARLLPGSEGVHDAAARAIMAALRPFYGDGSEPVKVLLAEPQPQRAGLSLKALALFFGALFAIAAVAQLIVTAKADRTKGWLEVECAHRCRMGGLECLPGGSWRQAFDEGDQIIEVWAPDEPTRWQPNTARVEVGKTTRFVCRPGVGVVLPEP